MGILDYFRTSEPDPADMERRYAEAYPELVGKSRDALINEQMKKFEETGARNRATQRVVPAAIARLPTTIIEGVQGIDQIVSSFGESSGSIPENLQRARYRKGGFDKVQEFLAQKQAEWQAANPDATPEQVKEFVSKYQNTPEYVAFEREQLPTFMGVPVYKKNEEINDAIDNFFGAPPDNVKTNTENVVQNVTQALVPVGIAKGLPKAVRIAAEFLLPGNQAKTTGGKLAVGATAGGVTAAIQEGMGRDVKPEEYTETLPKEPVPVAAVNFPELNTADGPEPPVTANAADKAEQIGAISSIIPGMQSLGIFAMLGAAAGLRPKMAVNVADAGPTYASKAGVVGPTVKESATDLRKAASGSFNNAIDERSPIQRGIAEAEGSYAEGVRGANEVGIHSPSAAGTSKRNHAEFGFLGDQQVTPLKNLDDMRTALRDFKKDDGTDGWDNVSKYLLARSELANRGRYIDEVNEVIQQKYIEHTAAVNAKDVAKANDVMQEIVKLQDDLKARMDKRFQLQQHSTDELKALIKNGPDVPGDDLKIGSRYVAAFDENNRAWMKQLEKDGLIEPEVMARINKHHDGSYAPMIEDELKGAKGLSRVLAKATRQLENADDPMSRLQQRVNPFSQRDIREGAEGVDFLMDPHNALFKRSNQYHNWREQHLYVRDVTERILNGKNADAVIEEKLVGSGGRTAFSDAEVYAMMNKRDLTGFTPVKLRGNNGKTTFIKFRDPLLTRALAAGPLDASIFRAMTSMLQRGATGAWNLGFAPMSTMLENAGVQVLRPRGTMGPTSNLIRMSAGGYGASPQLQKQIVDTIEKAVPVTRAADMLVGQAEAIYGGANWWWKQYRVYIADNMLTGLATDSGWFGAMMKMPAFRAWATKWAQNTVDTFHDTIEGALLDGKGLTYNTLAKNLEHTRELEKLFDIHVHPALRMAGSILAEPFNMVKLAIASYRDAAKALHYYRQVSYNVLKYGGEDKIPQEVFTKLQNEVRTLTGDFTKRMGNSKLQMIDDSIPYFRVMIQSNKNFYQRMLSDPKLIAATLTGIVVPKVLFEYEMANWDKEAYDWYYRQNNAYERSGFVGFVRPDIMYRRHVLGEEIPFSPDHIYKLYSPQEARPITEAITQAIRGLGAYKAGQKDKIADTSIGSQFASALGAAFSPGVPPPAAALLAQYNARFEPGELFKLSSPFKAGNPDRVNQMLATDSNVTNGIHNTLGALMGGIGKALAQGFATGEQVYTRTGKLEEAIWKGATEVKDRVMEGRAEPIPWLDLVNTRRYRQTPVTEELYKNREAFSVISGSRTGGKAFTPTDPILAYITDELRMASKTFEPKDFTTRYKELDTQLKAIENNRSVPVPERQKQSSDKLKELHQLSIEQQRWMLKEEKTIGLRELQPGLTIADAYKKQFGEPWSLQNFAQRVKKLKNAAAN